MSELLTIAAGFAASYIANNIPNIKDRGVKKSIKKCYDRAWKQWKCERVRELYEGKAFKHLDALKDYVCGDIQKIDAELQTLLSRWVVEMQNDHICSTFLLHWKIDSISQGIQRYPKFEEALINQARAIEEQVNVINHKVDSLTRSAERVEDNITEIKEILQGVSVKRAPADIDAILERYFNSFTNPIQVEPVPVCGSKEECRICLLDLLVEESAVVDHFIYILCCRGGLSWYSNDNIPGLLRDVIQKVERFANYNRGYMSEHLYARLRKYYQICQEFLDTFRLFVCVLNKDYESDPDGMTPVFDITYCSDGIQINPDFIEPIMKAFYSIKPSSVYLELADIYRTHVNECLSLISEIKGE